MKVLVTGGAGFIGSHVQDKLIETGHEVAILDNLRSGKKEFLNPQAQFFQQDIRNKDRLRQIFERFKPEVVFHLAAQNEVPYSMDHPYEDADINIIGTMNLMEAARQTGVKKVIYSNTGGAFYGDVPEDKLPIIEDQPVEKPTSFYGVSKLCAEIYLKLYGNLYHIPWLSLRYPNVYGPRQDGNKESGVVAIFTQKLLNKEQPTINGEGNHTRDYIYIGDVVEANLKALNFSDSHAFNISTGIETTTQQVFDTIEAELQTGIKPNYGSPRPGDAFRVSLSPQKAKNLLGWEPKVSFAQGLKATLQYYQNSKLT